MNIDDTELLLWLPLLSNFLSSRAGAPDTSYYISTHLFFPLPYFHLVFYGLHRQIGHT